METSDEGQQPRYYPIQHLPMWAVPSPSILWLSVSGFSGGIHKVRIADTTSSTVLMMRHAKTIGVNSLLVSTV